MVNGVGKGWYRAKRGEKGAALKFLGQKNNNSCSCSMQQGHSSTLFRNHVLKEKKKKKE